MNAEDVDITYVSLAKKGPEVLVREAGLTVFRKFHLSAPATFLADELSPALLQASSLGLDRANSRDVPKAPSTGAMKRFICCIPECFEKKIRHFGFVTGLSRHQRKAHPETTTAHRQACYDMYEAELQLKLIL